MGCARLKDNHGAGREDNFALAGQGQGRGALELEVEDLFVVRGLRHLRVGTYPSNLEIGSLPHERASALHARSTRLALQP